MRVIWGRGVFSRAAAVIGVSALVFLGAWAFPSLSRGTTAASGELVWSSQGVVDRVAPTVTGIPVQIECPFENLCFGTDAQGDLLSTGDPSSGQPWGRVGGNLSLPTCPSVDLCFAFSGTNVFFSTDPTGGPDAWQLSTSVGSGFDGVGQIVCPSTTLCLLTTLHGQLYATTGPWGATPAWRLSATFANRSLGELVCPSAALCLLRTLQDSPIFVSTDPTGGRASWQALQLSGLSSQGGIPGRWGLTCPTAQLCALATQSGTVFTSTNPAGGSGAWTEQQLPSQSYLIGISCPTAQLCLGTDGAGNVLSSTSPATGPWHKQSGPPIDPGTGEVTCLQATLCFLADGYSGKLFASSDPAGDASAWHETTFANSGRAGSPDVACPSTSFCLATISPLEPKIGYTGYGDLYSTSDPVNGPWTEQQRIDGYNPLTSVSCTGDGLCAAIDAAGDVLSSTDPAGGPASWQGERIDPAGHLAAVSCASRTLCVVTDKTGGVRTSTDPSDPAPSWMEASVDPGHSLTGIDCPSPTLCLAIDGSHRAFYATRPASGSGAWRSLVIRRTSGLDSVACASATHCLLGTSDGYVFTSTHPTGGAAKWKKATSRTLGGSAISSAACPSRHLCVVVTSGAELLTSSHPWSRRPRWRVQVKRNGGSGAGYYRYETEVACASAQVCIAIDNGVSCESEEDCNPDPVIDATTHPPGGWEESGSTYGNPAGIACQAGTRVCVAVDARSGRHLAVAQPRSSERPAWIRGHWAILRVWHHLAQVLTLPARSVGRICHAIARDRCPGPGGRSREAEIHR